MRKSWVSFWAFVEFDFWVYFFIHFFFDGRILDRLQRIIRPRFPFICSVFSFCIYPTIKNSAAFWGRWKSKLSNEWFSILFAFIGFFKMRILGHWPHFRLCPQGSGGRRTPRRAAAAGGPRRRWGPRTRRRGPRASRSPTRAPHAQRDGKDTVGQVS